MSVQQVPQWAEIHPADPNMYRTFFLQRDHLAKKIRIRGETNWVYGEVPPTIRVAYSIRQGKIRFGTLCPALSGLWQLIIDTT